VARRIHNRVENKGKRQELRNTATPAEAALWKHLQSRALDAKKFRRQHGIGPYIVDFYCPECRLVVELDGQPHFEFIADTYEVERAAYLQGLGLRVLRFENRIVFESLDAVLRTIREEVERTTPSAPLRNGTIF
jgi:very-short-patch-repair endonuclease